MIDAWSNVPCVCIYIRCSWFVLSYVYMFLCIFSESQMLPTALVVKKMQKSYALLILVFARNELLLMKFICELHAFIWFIGICYNISWCLLYLVKKWLLCLRIVMDFYSPSFDILMYKVNEWSSLCKLTINKSENGSIY